MREAHSAMKNASPLAALSLLAALALPLAACNNEPEVVDTRAPDPLAEQLKNAPAVALPPSVQASVTFRCKDNSLIYVEFFSGGTQANLRTEKGGTPTQLTADAAGNPYVGGGYTMTGNPKAVDLVAPGKGAQSCKA